MKKGEGGGDGNYGREEESGREGRKGGKRRFGVMTTKRGTKRQPNT